MGQEEITREIRICLQIMENETQYPKTYGLQRKKNRWKFIIVNVYVIKRNTSSQLVNFTLDGTRKIIN